MSTEFRVEKDPLGEVKIPADKLWGAETQRSLNFFSIGENLIPREMIDAYAILKKGAAIANLADARLSSKEAQLICTVCDEILAGQHSDMFPLHVWMTGSGTQFNMNINEVIANRCCQLSGTPLGSKKPIHPNDHVNMSQSSNDTFPSAMCIAVAIYTTHSMIPALQQLKASIEVKREAWKNVVKIGRTHMQDAIPLTVGQEFSGYVSMLDDNQKRLQEALSEVYSLVLGGTAVGTGLNTTINFAKNAIQQISLMTQLPFRPAINRFAGQGAHDALVQFSGTLKTLAVSLYKIANDIRLLSCGPRAGLNELIIPSNEPGSSIMPGKINPTQCEAMTMVCAQVIANDVAVSLGGAGGYLEMNVYKPLIIFNIMNSIRLLSNSMNNFKRFLIDGMKLNEEKINLYVEESLMLVTALSPVIGYDKSSEIANYAFKNNLTLKEAAMTLKLMSSEEFDLLVDPKKMVDCYIAKA